MGGHTSTVVIINKEDMPLICLHCLGKHEQLYGHMRTDEKQIVHLYNHEDKWTHTSVSCSNKDEEGNQTSIKIKKPNL